MIRNRIKGHRRVRAGDLVPHEMNPRTHSDTQREALQALYDEVGFSRSLLAYETGCQACMGTGNQEGTFGPKDVGLMPCAACHGEGRRLKLIDGHLRQSMDPDMEVDVEVLDVTDEEAAKLLLSIDPLAALAGYDKDQLDRLREVAATDSDHLAALWESLDQSAADTEKATRPREVTKEGAGEEALTYQILVDCESEQQQRSLLKRFKKEGLKCHARTG